jgi:hypothetical protein
VAGLLFFIRESRPTQLLEKEVKKAREALGNQSLRAANPDHVPNFNTFLKIGLLKPVQLLITEPIVFAVSFMSATAFALIYLFTEALPVVYVDLGLDEKQATLPFLAAAIGVMASSLTRLYDRRQYAKFRSEYRIPTPEDKLIGFSLGAPALAAGLWYVSSPYYEAEVTDHFDEGGLPGRYHLSYRPLGQCQQSPLFSSGSH